MAGHKTTYTQMERYKLIDSMFCDGEHLPFEVILEALRTELRDDRLSDSSVRRDFRYMRDELGAPLEYEKKSNGWHYTKPFKLPSEGFSYEEILQLHLIRKLINQHSSKDILFKSLSGLIEKITPSTEENVLDERFFVPLHVQPVIDKDVAEKVLYSINKNHMLDFNYYSKWEPEERHRKILPYQLIVDEGNLFLYGANKREKDNPRLFNLSKMHHVEVIESETFELPDNFRFHEEEEQGRFGAFQYDDYFDFKIEFTGDARSNVREFIWSDNQKIEENLEEKKTILSFTSSQWLPVQKWILSFGADAKPLEPDWFVEEWKEIVRKMAEKI